MGRLRIEYGTGYMELIVETFFPCKMPAMKKAARLINQYCTDETRAGLLSELREMICTGIRWKSFQRDRPHTGAGGRSLTRRKPSENG